MVYRNPVVHPLVAASAFEEWENYHPREIRPDGDVVTIAGAACENGEVPEGKVMLILYSMLYASNENRVACKMKRSRAGVALSPESFGCECLAQACEASLRASTPQSNFTSANFVFACLPYPLPDADCAHFYLTWSLSPGNCASCAARLDGQQ